MKAKWYKTAVKLIVLVTLEILVSLAGLDDLADCVEFVFNHEFIAVPTISFAIE